MPNPNRYTRDALKINRRHVTTDTELSFANTRGRFRFVSATYEGDKLLWITVYGGSGHHRQFHSFNVDSVRAVHRIAKLRPA